MPCNERDRHAFFRAEGNIQKMHFRYQDQAKKESGGGGGNQPPYDLTLKGKSRLSPPSPGFWKRGGDQGASSAPPQPPQRRALGPRSRRPSELRGRAARQAETPELSPGPAWRGSFSAWNCQPRVGRAGRGRSGGGQGAHWKPERDAPRDAWTPFPAPRRLETVVIALTARFPSFFSFFRKRKER